MNHFDEILYTPSPEVSKITDNLFVGTLYGARNFDRHNPYGINVVVNVSCEKFNEDGSIPAPGLKVYDILLYDGCNPPLHKVARIISTISSEIAKGNKVLVNCHAGVSRSVSMAAGYLVADEFVKDVDDAVAYIKYRRPCAFPSAQVLKGVRVFFREGLYANVGSFEYHPIDPEDPAEINRNKIQKAGFLPSKLGLDWID